MTSSQEYKAITQRVRNRACGAVRRQFPDEFADLYAKMKAAVPDRTAQASYRAAEVWLAARHADAYEAASAKVRADNGWPKRHGGKPKRKVSLVRHEPPRGGIRTHIDPTDAMILHRRGLSVAQIASYDGCTQVAVVKALVPQLRALRSRHASWFTHDPQPMSAAEIAQATGLDARQVEKFLAAA